MNRSPFPPDRTPALPRHRQIRSQRGFSLVEVTMALGIAGFTFTALLGLLSVGLSNFSQAIDATVETQIVQHVGAEVRQARFSELPALNVNADPGDAAPPAADYFFDEQGQAGAKITADNHVYSASVQVYPVTEVAVGQTPSRVAVPIARANLAEVQVTVRKLTGKDAPARVFTSFIANNGL